MSYGEFEELYHEELVGLTYYQKLDLYQLVAVEQMDIDDAKESLGI